MTSEFIGEILQHTPEIRCFAIGSNELAIRQAEKLARRMPRTKRRQAARNHYRRWERQIDSILQDGRSADYETTIHRLESLPLEAVRLAFDAEAADTLIDDVANTIRQSQRSGIGIMEQYASDEIVFVWLWNDV